MDQLTQDELLKRITEVTPPAISLYMPMTEAGRDVRGNPIHLKNGLSEARGQLEASGVDKAKIDELLETAQSLLSDTPFWQHQEAGLAILIDQAGTYIYKLPIELEPITAVGDQFHIKPLLTYLGRQTSYYLLALSQNDARFFHGTLYSISEIEVEEMPESLEDALWYEDPEKRTQFHSNARGESGGDVAFYHGHADVETEEGKRILRYFQQIDDALKPVLNEQKKPLILAGVEYLFPIFAQATSYQHLSDKHITGNPEHWEEEALRAKAAEIIQPHHAEEVEKAVASYQEAAAYDKAAVGAKETAQVAFQGRVETLLLAKSEQCWGKFDQETGQVELNGESSADHIDILDFAAIQTMQNGGRVLTLEPEEMPDEQPAVAILRF